MDPLLLGLILSDILIAIKQDTWRESSTIHLSDIFEPGQQDQSLLTNASDGCTFPSSLEHQDFKNRHFDPTALPSIYMQDSTVCKMVFGTLAGCGLTENDVRYWGFNLPLSEAEHLPFSGCIYQDDEARGLDDGARQASNRLAGLRYLIRRSLLRYQTRLERSP